MYKLLIIFFPDSHFEFAVHANLRNKHYNQPSDEPNIDRLFLAIRLIDDMIRDRRLSHPTRLMNTCWTRREINPSAR